VKLLLHTYLYMWDTEVCGVMGLPKVAMKASDLLASIVKITFCELLEPPINIDTTSKNFDACIQTEGNIVLMLIPKGALKYLRRYVLFFFFRWASSKIFTQNSTILH